MASEASDTIREVFLRFWNEYVVFNTEDVGNGDVVAQGECSGKYYILKLDDDLNVVDYDLYT